MVISPILRGLFGLETNALERKVVIAPHIPADWNSFTLRNVRIGETTADLVYRRTPDEITLDIDSGGTEQLDFSPALSPRAHVVSAELNGRRIPFQIKNNPTDLHTTVRASLLPGKATLRLKVQNDFDISYSHSLPPLGASSRDLRIISGTWSAAHDALTLQISGTAGSHYQLNLRNPEQIRSVDGGELKNAKLHVTFPSGSTPVYTSRGVVLHFVPAKHMKQ